MTRSYKNKRTVKRKLKKTTIKRKSKNTIIKRKSKRIRGGAADADAHICAYPNKIMETLGLLEINITKNRPDTETELLKNVSIYIKHTKENSKAQQLSPDEYVDKFSTIRYSGNNKTIVLSYYNINLDLDHQEKIISHSDILKSGNELIYEFHGRRIQQINNTPLASIKKTINDYYKTNATIFNPSKQLPPPP